MQPRTSITVESVTARSTVSGWCLDILRLYGDIFFKNPARNHHWSLLASTYCARMSLCTVVDAGCLSSSQGSP